jgi:uncharacterized protein YbbK (DUF523 family)
MLKILISACLLGQPVRYNGLIDEYTHPVLERWKAEGRMIAFCPETAGGLPTPRASAEITGKGGGRAVINAQALVLDASGRDVSAAFVRGGELAVQLAAEQGLYIAVLKEGSPSCGTQQIYDGSFTGQKISGAGVCAEALGHAGLRVFNENQLAEAADLIALIEARTQHS